LRNYKPTFKVGSSSKFEIIEEVVSQKELKLFTVNGWTLAVIKETYFEFLEKKSIGSFKSNHFRCGYRYFWNGFI
jgi:hypothetical protein